MLLLLLLLLLWKQVKEESHYLIKMFDINLKNKNIFFFNQPVDVVSCIDHRLGLVSLTENHSNTVSMEKIYNGMESDNEFFNGIVSFISQAIYITYKCKKCALPVSSQLWMEH